MNFDRQTKNRMAMEGAKKCNDTQVQQTESRTKRLVFLEHRIESELNSGVTDAQCSMKFVIDIQS